MPTFSYDKFEPTAYLVRVESRELTSCFRLSWETNSSETLCASWEEAQATFAQEFEWWRDNTYEAFSDPEYWIKTRDCFVGEWTIEVFSSNAILPRKYAVDCQVYVRFSPKDPADQDPQWGETDVWRVMNQVLWYDMREVYGIELEPDPEPDQHDAEPDYEPEPEPVHLVVQTDDNWYVIASDFLEKINEEVTTQVDPEPDQPEYEPETIIIPIPSWEWVETEPEPEPEPIRITRGWLHVRLHLHDQIVVGRKSYNLPLEREHALGHAKQYTKCICDLITHMLGVQPETDWEIQSPNWGDPTNAYSDWCEWTYLWSTDFYQCGVEKAVFEWGFDHNFPPIEWEEKESWVEPLWLGCITIDLPYGKRSTCLAHDTRFAIGEWIKGSVDAYALISGRNPDDVIGRYLLTELDRAEATYRDINVTVGDLVGEGIRLI